MGLGGSEVAPAGGYQPKLPGMEPALAEDLLGYMAQRIATLAGDAVAVSLRRASAGAREWRSAQPAREGSDPQQLRYAVETDRAIAHLLDDARLEGATLVVRLTPLAVVNGLHGLASRQLDSATSNSAGSTTTRHTLDDPVFRLQLAYSRARRDAEGPRWEEADGIPGSAVDEAGAMVDLVAALLESPRRMADPTTRPEQAAAALGAVATAYLAWEGELPPHLPVVAPPVPALTPRLLASAAAGVLERGMSGLGIVARERI